MCKRGFNAISFPFSAHQSFRTASGNKRLVGKIYWKWWNWIEEYLSWRDNANFLPLWYHGSSYEQDPATHSAAGLYDSVSFVEQSFKQLHFSNMKTLIPNFTAHPIMLSARNSHVSYCRSHSPRQTDETLWTFVRVTKLLLKRLNSKCVDVKNVIKNLKNDHRWNY